MSFGELWSDAWCDDMLVAAYRVATASPDLSTQNGAIAINLWGEIIGQAPNTYPPGLVVTDEMQTQRPDKYLWIEHAETGALLDVIRHHRIAPHALVCPWAACAACARAIAFSGVKLLVRHHPPAAPSPGGHWADDVDAGDRILSAAGVEIITVRRPLPAAPEVLRDGEWLRP